MTRPARLEPKELRKRLRAVLRGMEFFHNTDGGSRHVKMMAEWLIASKGPYTIDDPQLWASSLIGTLDWLYKHRKRLEQLTGDPFGRTPEEKARDRALIFADDVIPPYEGNE